MTDIVEDLERWSLHPGEMCPACHAIDTPEPGCVCDVAPRAKAEIERLRTELSISRQCEVTDENERHEAALMKLADDDTYIVHAAEWHDVGHMSAGIQAIARAALENK